MFNLLVHFRVMHTCLQQRDQQSVVSAFKIILVLPFLDHLLINCFEHSGEDVFLAQAAISQDLAELNELVCLVLFKDHSKPFDKRVSHIELASWIRNVHLSQCVVVTWIDFGSCLNLLNLSLVNLI